MSAKYEVKSFVEFERMCECVWTAANNCFDEDGRYMAPAYELAVRQALARAFTDVELPKDTAELYQFVFTSGIYEAVIENGNRAQIDSIIAAIDSEIELRIDNSEDELKKDVEASIVMIHVWLNKMNEIMSVLDVLNNDEFKDSIAQLKTSAKVIQAGVDAVRQTKK